MEDENDVICIYDDTKESLDKCILKIYANFVERELKCIT
jgi:hypothetical protein